MAYRIAFTEFALKSLNTYPQKDRKLIVKDIEQLIDDPFDINIVKKLVDFDVALRLVRKKYRVLCYGLSSILVVDIRQRKYEKEVAILNRLRRWRSYQKGFSSLDLDSVYYLFIMALLSEPEKLEDFLDYLHILDRLRCSSKRFDLEEVKQQFRLA